MTTTSAAHRSCRFNNKRPKTISSSGLVKEQDQEAPELLEEMKRKEPKKVPNGSVMGSYKECRKNHAANIGGYAVDGCREFMLAGEEGTSAGFKCAACSCHRNFHRREIKNECYCDCSSISATPK